MKKVLDRLCVGAFAVAVALIASAIAQVPSLIITSPTGLEQIEVLVESTGTVVTNPLKQQVTINQIRNASGVLTVAGGTTVATTIPNTASVVLGLGAITTWNVTLPVLPEDGQNVELGCPGGDVTTETVAATGGPSGVTIVGTNSTSCTAATPTHQHFIYSKTANVWYRVD